jgi:RNA polymerase sigma-70 factor, ECF subfamily
LNQIQPPAQPEISEEEISALVRQAQPANADAFAELLRVIGPRLHRQALFLTRDEHQALDLIQETVMQAWKHLARYDGRAQFFTWICTIMFHRHYDWLRRVRTRAFAWCSLPDRDVAPDHAPDPSRLLENSDDDRLVRRSLDQLPNAQRSVVYLRFYAGESLDGIAALLNCSVGTVKSRLFHALRRLAKMENLKQLRRDL